MHVLLFPLKQEKENSNFKLFTYEGIAIEKGQLRNLHAIPGDQSKLKDWQHSSWEATPGKLMAQTLPVAQNPGFCLNYENIIKEIVKWIT